MHTTIDNTTFKTKTMENLLTKKEEERIAKSCKENPYKMFKVVDMICKELQLMDIATFARVSTKSKRTIYNLTDDEDGAGMEFMSICGVRFIPAILNKKILI